LTEEISTYQTTITTLRTSMTTSSSKTTELRTALESATTRVASYKLMVERLEAYDNALLEKY